MEADLKLIQDDGKGWFWLVAGQNPGGGSQAVIRSLCTLMLARSLPLLHEIASIWASCLNATHATPYKGHQRTTLGILVLHNDVTQAVCNQCEIDGRWNAMECGSFIFCPTHPRERPLALVKEDNVDEFFEKVGNQNFDYETRGCCLKLSDLCEFKTI